MADDAVAAWDRPLAEEVFAGGVARLVELVERWQAQAETERWPAVPLSGLNRDDPRRPPPTAVERVRSAAALRRGMSEQPDGGPDP